MDHACQTPHALPRSRVPFVVRILAAMTLGGLTGWWFGPQVERLGDFGDLIINLIKALAGPLLFLAVIDAFLRTRVRARSAMAMILISLTNATIAIGIGLSISNLIRPGDHLKSSLRSVTTPGDLLKTRKFDFVRELTNYIPRNLFQPFLDNSVITIVLTAIFMGWALRVVKSEQHDGGDHGIAAVDQVVATLYRTLEVMIGAVITLVPLAIFGVVAKTIGRDGFQPLLGLGWYVGVAVLGLTIQVVVVYQAWIILVARMPLRRFWSGAWEAVVYALGSSSSLATLPVTLRCLDRMQVSRESARLAACVGTNLNNDGILLYEAMAVLFVAQV